MGGDLLGYNQPPSRRWDGGVCWIDMSGCRWALTRTICACGFMNTPWQYDNDWLRILSRQQRVQDAICKRTLVRLTKTNHSSLSTNRNVSVSDSGQGNWRNSPDLLYRIWLVAVKRNEAIRYRDTWYLAYVALLYSLSCTSPFHYKLLRGGWILMSGDVGTWMSGSKPQVYFLGLPIEGHSMCGASSAMVNGAGASIGFGGGVETCRAIITRVLIWWDIEPKRMNAPKSS